MHIERLQTGHQGPLCTGYHQVVSDGAAASRSQDRGWVVGGGWGAKRKGCRLECSHRRQGRAKKEEKKGKEKRTNESETMIADLSYRCATGGGGNFAVMTQRLRMSLMEIIIFSLVIFYH